MSDFNQEIRDIAEDYPEAAVRIRKAFPEAFPKQGKFIIHIGSGKTYDPSNISCLYFFGDGKEDTGSRQMVKLDGTWSDLTSSEYPDAHNILFTGILKIEDGVLVEVNVKLKEE